MSDETPAALRARAAALIDEAEALRPKDRDRALRLLDEAEALVEWADRVERLRGRLKPRGAERMLNDMTQTQIERRARAVAVSRAESSQDPRRKALTAAYGSQAKAAKALKISPAALVGYLNGTWPCPGRVARAVLAKAGLAADAWPAGVVD